MLKIRLQRIGKKNSPSYRVVLVEHTAPPKGKFQEILGSYNPKTKQKNFKKERIEHWLSRGVQFSPTIHNLLVDAGILNKAKIKAWKPKKRKGEEKPVEVKPTKATEKPVETKIEEPKAEQPAPETPKIESDIDNPQQ
jgi:small subunit ribosomal protein S16